MTIEIRQPGEPALFVSVRGRLEIGRECHGVLLADPQVSRRHLAVDLDPSGRLVVEDLGSTNGTTIDGDRLDAPMRLDTGRIIRFGATTMRLDAPVAAVTTGAVPARAFPAVEPPPTTEIAGAPTPVVHRPTAVTSDRETWTSEPAMPLDDASPMDPAASNDSATPVGRTSSIDAALPIDGATDSDGSRPVDGATPVGHEPSPVDGSSSIDADAATPIGAASVRDPGSRIDSATPTRRSLPRDQARDEARDADVAPHDSATVGRDAPGGVVGDPMLARTLPGGATSDGGRRHDVDDVDEMGDRSEHDDPGDGDAAWRP